MNLAFAAGKQGLREARSLRSLVPSIADQVVISPQTFFPARASHMVAIYVMSNTDSLL